METLFFILIFLIIHIIYLQVKKEPVYKYSTADINYINKLITIRFILINIPTENYFDIKHIFYVNKDLTNNDVVNYVIKNHKNLFKNELTDLRAFVSKKYNMDIMKYKIAIKIEDL